MALTQDKLINTIDKYRCARETDLKSCKIRQEQLITQLKGIEREITDTQDELSRLAKAMDCLTR